MIHPSSYIHSSVKIPDSSIIGPWCIIEKGVEIEENVIIEMRTHVYEGVSIGANTHIYDGAIIGAPPQDLKYAGEKTSLKIGENVIIREYCTLNRGTIQGGGITFIADKVLIMAYSHVAHDCVIEEGAVLANGCQLGGHVRIGKYATIGGTTAIQQHNQVGAYAFVGGTLKVDRDVPPASKAFGNPLKWGGLNLHALRLHSNIFSQERIDNLSRDYRKLYRSTKSIAEVIEELKKSPEPLFQAFFDDFWSGTLIRP